MATPLTVTAKDGYALAADLFPAEKPRAVALLAGAMGVARRLYAPFGEHLAKQGITALALDYRGIGGSAPKSLKGFEASLHGWGELDLTAGAAKLKELHPSLPLLWVGHSAGGQLLGILPEVPVHAALLIGSQSGYWKHWAGLPRGLMFSLWHAFIPSFLAVNGYLPMKALGQGEDVPAGVAREWAQWGKHPRYIASYAQERGGLNFAKFKGPLRALAVSDDGYAPESTVRPLLAEYQNTKPELVVVRPADVGQKKIGHFGFFRRQFEQTLWTDAATWLLQTLPTAA